MVDVPHDHKCDWPDCGGDLYECSDPNCTLPQGPEKMYPGWCWCSCRDRVLDQFASIMEAINMVRAIAARDEFRTQLLIKDNIAFGYWMGMSGWVGKDGSTKDEAVLGHRDRGGIFFEGTAEECLAEAIRLIAESATKESES